MERKLIYVASPYGAPDQDGIDANLLFVKEAGRAVIAAGHTPVIVHLVYPALLDDAVPEQRALGIQMDFQLLDNCDVLAYYVHKGVSNGMDQEIRRALEKGIPVYRLPRIGGTPVRVRDTAEYEDLLHADRKGRD